MLWTSWKVVHPFCSQLMALLKYFSLHSAFLPDPNELLLAKVKPEAIESLEPPRFVQIWKWQCEVAAWIVSEIYAQTTCYICMLDVQRNREIRQLHNKVQQDKATKLSKSTVRTWNGMYTKELQRRRPMDSIYLLSMRHIFTSEECMSLMFMSGQSGCFLRIVGSTEQRLYSLKVYTCLSVLKASN